LNVPSRGRFKTEIAVVDAYTTSAPSPHPTVLTLTMFAKDGGPLPVGEGKEGRIAS
jgi:hypothetical protein